MKKLLIALLIVLVLTVAIAQWLLNDPGYVLFIHGDWRLETTLGFLAFVALVVWLASAVVLLAAFSLWRRATSEQLAIKHFKRAVRHLGEGRWDKAQKQFARTTRGLWPYPGLLGAAYAAHQQGHIADRDVLLKAAENDRDGERLAIRLRLFGHVLQEDAAIASELEEQLAHDENNVPLRCLAAKQAEQQQDWDRLQKHLNRLPPAAAPLIDKIALAHGRLQHIADADATSADSLKRLRKCWHSLSSTQQQIPALVAQYAGYQMHFGDTKGAVKTLDLAIQNQWNEGYAAVLADLPIADAAAFLKQVEAWIKRYPASAGLALVAGRTALKAALWGKAESYFRFAGEAGSAVAWAELARLKQAQGNEADAVACLREQARQVTGELPALPLPSQPA